MNKISISILICFISGCSLLPYENEFACRKTDDYGKCVSVDVAYQEAVTGESKHPTIKQKSPKRWFGWFKKRQEKKESVSTEQKDAVTQYSTARYREMASLIDAPRTPMLKPTKTIRTLILNYSPNSDNKVFYMPRYVYSIIDDPAWVLGDYVNKPQINTKSISPWE